MSHKSTHTNQPTPTRNRRSPNVNYYHAQIGDVVSARVRFGGVGFENEPYDVVHTNQPFGYVNAKLRPCLVLGEHQGHVVLAPCYSASNEPPQSTMQHGGLELCKQEALAAQMFQKDGSGTFVSCANLQQVPIDQFYYTSFVGSLPLPTLRNYFQELVGYYEESQTNPHKRQKAFDLQKPQTLDWLKTSSFDASYESVPIHRIKTIHPDDPEVYFRNLNDSLKSQREECARLSTIDTTLDLNVSMQLQLNQDALENLEQTQAFAKQEIIALSHLTKSQAKFDMIEHTKQHGLGTFSQANHFTRLDNLPTFADRVAKAMQADKTTELEHTKTTSIKQPHYQPNSQAPRQLDTTEHSFN